MVILNIHEPRDLKALPCVPQAGGGREFKMAFEVKNESKVGQLCLSDKVNSAAKIGQDAYLDIEKWTERILGSRKTERVLRTPKSV